MFQKSLNRQETYQMHTGSGQSSGNMQIEYQIISGQIVRKVTKCIPEVVKSSGNIPNAYRKWSNRQESYQEHTGSGQIVRKHTNSIPEVVKSQETYQMHT